MRVSRARCYRWRRGFFAQRVGCCAGGSAFAVNDVHARREPGLKQPEGSLMSPQDSSREEEYKRRRKAQPVNVSLLRTLDWVARLPPSVKPTALVRQYARITNIVAAAWDDPNSFGSYVDRLFRNDCGNRKG